MWITHFLKVTQSLFKFKWNRKFHLLKALSALRNTFSSHGKKWTVKLNIWSVKLIILEFQLWDNILHGVKYYLWSVKTRCSAWISQSVWESWNVNLSISGALARLSRSVSVDTLDRLTILECKPDILSIFKQTIKLWSPWQSRKNDR